MREHLFKGKRIDNGNWVCGTGVVVVDKDYVAIPLTKDVTSANYAITLAKIIPETVCQFSGRNDKSGNKIFEGSILKGKFGTGMGGKSTRYKEFNFAIMYHEPTSSFCIEMPKGYGDYRFHPHWEQCEIIGNIHDNPELLQSL